MNLQYVPWQADNEAGLYSEIQKRSRSLKTGRMSYIFPPERGEPASSDHYRASVLTGDEVAELRTSPHRPSPVRRDAQIRAWWDIVLRGKWIILITMIVLLVPWTWYVFQQPYRYQASSVVLVRKQDGDLSNVLPTNARSAIFGQGERRVGNEMLVIRESLPLAQRVAVRLIEARRVPGTREPLTVLQGGSDIESVARRAQRYITVQPLGREVDGISITAVSTVPGEARFIANLFAEEYVKRAQDDSRSGYRSSREFLQDQIAEQEQRLEEQEAALRNFMQTSGTVDLDLESSNLVTQLATLQANRDESQILLQMKRSEAESLQRELATIQPEIARRLASGVDQQLAAL
ncbi:MAG TPA: hypothetical protein VD948_00180, partial [Rhodothermales bacterium]|nr:hypothetical protein [Rhodothermales bacterium]